MGFIEITAMRHEREGGYMMRETLVCISKTATQTLVFFFFFLVLFSFLFFCFLEEGMATLFSSSHRRKQVNDCTRTSDLLTLTPLRPEHPPLCLCCFASEMTCWPTATHAGRREVQSFGAGVSGALPNSGLRERCHPVRAGCARGAAAGHLSQILQLGSAG